MLRFDWHSFCVQHNVPFVTSGPNTARGHISVKCPYCGASDKSQHMGLCLDVDDPAWGCFRNATHRGRNPRRLVQKLLGITFEAAWRIVQAYNRGTADEGELQRAIAFLQAQEAPSEPAAPSMALPPEFKVIEPGQGYAGRFIAYLEGRGFLGHVDALCERYGLHYVLTGDFAWRLIFPILEEDGELAGWTGRDIRPSARLRYRTTEELPNRAVYNSHHAVREERETLVIVEGPVDCVKIDYFGAEMSVSAVAALGTALPAERRSALALLARRFDNVALLFDEETLSEVVGLVPEISEVAGMDVQLWRPGAKDPGEMTEEQVKLFLSEKLGP